MQEADVLESPSLVCIGRNADMLACIDRPGVELAAWQRGQDPAWAGWLAEVPAEALPACRTAVSPDDAGAALNASCEARGTSAGPARDALVADMARLVRRFAALARTTTVQVRLDRVSGDACRRWHRDCVPLRMICTYRGPGTLWVPPALGAAVLARPDDEVPQALAFEAGDVALFKGCGWAGQSHDAGIVHRSPRIAGTGVTRLVLVLDAARPATETCLA